MRRRDRGGRVDKKKMTLCTQQRKNERKEQR